MQVEHVRWQGPQEQSRSDKDPGASPGGLRPNWPPALQHLHSVILISKNMLVTAPALGCWEDGLKHRPELSTRATHASAQQMWALLPRPGHGAGAHRTCAHSNTEAAAGLSTLTLHSATTFTYKVPYTEGNTG